MIRLRQVVKTYCAGERDVPVLREVSFDIAAGQFCAITGPSGSGKSTLLNLIGLLDRPTGGSIVLNDQEVGAASADRCAQIRNDILGFVFQAFHLLPRLTAWENVALPLLYRGVPRTQRRERALAMLDAVGLADRADHRPSQLSGGQCQRVALARALVGEPRVILADEPTGSLDSVTAGEIMELLAGLSRRAGVTVVMVTHDRDLAGACDRRIEMLDGRVLLDTAAA